MKRETRAVVGMVFVAPFLAFTFCALFLTFHALQFAYLGTEWWVENQTVGPIWVTPVTRSEGRVGRLPHYPSRLVTYSSPPGSEVLIRPGERCRLVIDTWVHADIGGSGGLVIRTAGGDYRSLNGIPGEKFVLDDPGSLPSASDAEIAELQRPLGPVNFGIPFWLTITLGLAAPVGLWRLWRIYHIPTP